MFDFDDLSKFSDEVVTFKEGWEDNRYRLPKPGTKFVGVIERVHDIHEVLPKKDGDKNYLIATLDLASIDPPGTLLKEVKLYGSPSLYGNKRSDIENLIMSAKMPYEKERTMKELAETIWDIWNYKIHIGFDIRWVGSSTAVYKKTLMEKTNTTSFEDVKGIATSDDYNEARKAATVAQKDFKVNGEFESKITCPKLGDPNFVYAELKLRNLYQADDVDDQLGG